LWRSRHQLTAYAASTFLAVHVGPDVTDHGRPASNDRGRLR
jgi:hypothetical protein